MLVSGFQLEELKEPTPRRDTGLKRVTIFILTSIEYPVSRRLWHNIFVSIEFS